MKKRINRQVASSHIKKNKLKYQYTNNYYLDLWFDILKNFLTLLFRKKLKDTSRKLLLCKTSLNHSFLDFLNLSYKYLNDFGYP